MVKRPNKSTKTKKKESLEYTLDDFQKLAYEFAIRNPKVIKLIKAELTDCSVKKLLTFGIDATAYYCTSCSEDPEGEQGTENTIRELYLDYAHFKDIDHHPYSCELDDDNNFRGYKNIHQIFTGNIMFKELGLIEKENSITAINRIRKLIETRGRKLERLMNKDAFQHYDKVTFEKESVYKIDPTTNKKKTINSDIDYVKEWIVPEKYLLLLPIYSLIL